MGEQRAALEAVAEEAGLHDRVVFTGWIPYGELGPELATADVLVFPTWEDVWGMAPLEAMAMGTPVICSTAAGASELIKDGVNGLLVHPARPDTLAETIERFLLDPSAASRMGAAAATEMRALSSEAAAEALAEVATLLDAGDR